MNILMRIHEHFVRRWILFRMAASEFSFKEPFDIKEEYSIMVTGMGLNLCPFFMTIVFLCARLGGSMEQYRFIGIVSMFAISFGVSYLMIRKIKGAPFITETIREYESLDIDTRKKIFSFKNGCYVIFMVMLPWFISAAAIALICFLIPLAH